MKLTHAHAAFWLAHHAPQWSRPFVGSKAAGIDGCINAHAGIRTTGREYTLNAGNLCVILRLMRRRGANLRQELLRIAENPGTLVNPVQRARYARRWAERIERTAA